MSQKTAEIKLTKKHRDFCKLKYEDRLNDEKIAELCGIAPRTVYEWIKRPEIITEIERLGKADTERAIWFFRRNSLRAAQATVKLTETRVIKDGQGKPVSQDFVQPGEIVRKAAADILQAVEINIKAGESGIASGNVLIYVPDNQRYTKNKEGENGK